MSSAEWAKRVEKVKKTEAYKQQGKYIRTRSDYIHAWENGHKAFDSHQLFIFEQ